MFHNFVFYVDFLSNLVTSLVTFGALRLSFGPLLDHLWLTFSAPWLTFGVLGIFVCPHGVHFFTFGIMFQPDGSICVHGVDGIA